MPAFDPNKFYEDMTETEHDAVATLVAEGKFDRAAVTVQQAAVERDMHISLEQAVDVVDMYKPDLPPDEATARHFPNKEDKPSLGMATGESLSDPDARLAPTANEVSSSPDDGE
jgi:hypothetical protein